MKATKQQIREFLKKHDLSPTDQLAHDATRQIKTAFDWAKIFLSTKDITWGFYNVRDFKNMIRIDKNCAIGVSTNGVTFLL